MISYSKYFIIAISLLLFSFPVYAADSENITDSNSSILEVTDEKDDTSLQVKILQLITNLGKKVDSEEKLEVKKEESKVKETSQEELIQKDKDLFIKKSKKYLDNINVSLDNSIIEVVYEKSKEKWVDPYLVFAQMKKESTFNINAYNAWCYGYLQVSKYPVIWYNKIYWASFEVSDLKKPRVNLEIWIDYLRQKLEAYWSEHLALMAYNWWDWYLQRSLKAWYTSSSYSRYITSLRDEIKNIQIN